MQYRKICFLIKLLTSPCTAVRDCLCLSAAYTTKYQLMELHRERTFLNFILCTIVEVNIVWQDCWTWWHETMQVSFFPLKLAQCKGKTRLPFNVKFISTKTYGLKSPRTQKHTKVWHFPSIEWNRLLCKRLVVLRSRVCGVDQTARRVRFHECSSEETETYFKIGWAKILRLFVWKVAASVLQNEWRHRFPSRKGNEGMCY